MPKALLVSPKNPITFWSFDETLRMLGKRNIFPPLGLLTIAGMLPDSYELRVVDMNVRPLRDEDLDWADIVLTSSMIIHGPSLEGVLARCNAAGIPVLNGGPLPTQYHAEIKGDGVFYLGEAENGFVDVVERLLASPSDVGHEPIDRRGRFQDLKTTPVPRWDLIDFDDYSNMVVQMTRGCPESCTFCNIPSLYGHKTRIKSRSRIVQELDALYDAGWRGAVMAVDDNFVGNTEAIRTALEEDVIPWQESRNYPFQFHTQASIRVSDDSRLLDAMWRAGFDKIFAGIESPVAESLKHMGARKNLQGDTPLLEKVRRMQAAGFEVQAGFIMGLDTDPDDIADRMIAFIREAGIPVAMVGILGVLRDTPDYKRFQRAGRLVEGVRYSGDSGIFSRNLSFVPAIDPAELLRRHRRTVLTLNSPEVFFERCSTLFDHLGRRPLAKMQIRKPELRALFASLWDQGITGGYRATYWRFLARTLWKHPGFLPDAVRLAVQGQHLILTTQQALKVDEVSTFLEEAAAGLERFAAGSREAFQQVESYAGRLMQALQVRLIPLQDGRRALQHNATVLQDAAHQYAESIREEFRYQIREPLARFQEEVQKILDAHAGVAALAGQDSAAT